MSKKSNKENRSDEESPQTNFGPSDTDTVRIAQLDCSPSLNDLYQALESAKAELGKKFELSWKVAGNKSDFILSVACPPDQGIPPDWSLSMPDGATAWSYLGDDVALIQLHVRNLSGSNDNKVPAFPDFSFHNINSADASDPFPFGELGTVATVEVIDWEPFNAPIARDFNALRQYHEMLQQPETGIISQWWIMYFLEQEYYRYKACSFPVTLAVFDLTMRTPRGLSPLSVSHIKQIGQRVTNAKRKIDLFGHFGSTLYALMLPHTELGAGTMVANRIKSLITDHNQEFGWDNSQINVRMGIAAIPTSAQDLNGLIMQAVEDLKATVAVT